MQVKNTLFLRLEFYYYSALVTYHNIYHTINTFAKPYSSHNAILP